MVKNRTTSTYKATKTSNWSLLLGIAFITLYVHTEAFDPFNTPKLIILVLLSSWLAGSVFAFIRIDKTKILTKANLPYLLSITFLLTLVISFVTTDVRIIALLGDTQRRNGLLQYTSVIIIFLYAYLKTNFSNAINIYRTAIVVCALMSLYGVMQISGNDFRKWNNPYNSMISTLGNPNFASAMLAILFLLSFFALFLKEISRLFKLVSLIALFFSLYAIIKSQSLQGLITIAVALLAYTSIYVYIQNKRIGLVVILTSGAFGITAILGMLQIGPLAALLYKSSVTVRGYYWQAAGEMFFDKPLTGVGLDRYGAYFKQYRNPEYSLKYGFDITSSNAHNTILQLFSTAGVFVGITYLIIMLFVLLIGVYKLPRIEPSEQKVLLGLICAFIGFQAQSFISIDNIGISVWGWLFAGSILGLCWNAEITNTISSKVALPKKERVSFDLYFIQKLTSLLFLVPAIIFSYYLGQSEVNTSKVQAFTAPNSPDNRTIVFSYAKKVFSNPLSDPYYKFISSLSLYDMGYKEEAYKEINKLLIQDPINLNYLNGLSVLLSIDNKKDEEIEIRKKIATIDPWNAKNYFNLMVIYQDTGDLSSALAIKSKILSFASQTEVGRMTEARFTS
jgi:O-antigen ligase